jgi:hypothetical protein
MFLLKFRSSFYRIKFENLLLTNSGAGGLDFSDSFAELTILLEAGRLGLLLL